MNPCLNKPNAPLPHFCMRTKFHLFPKPNAPILYPKEMLPHFCIWKAMLPPIFVREPNAPLIQKQMLPIFERKLNSP